MQRDFVGYVSHEFRAPLAIIKGFAATLRDGALDDRKNALEFVRTIEKHAERLSRLVEDLLELAALDSGPGSCKAEAVALSAFALKCLQGFAPMTRRKGITAECRITPGLKVRVGRTELERVLQNLLDNAVRYNRSGGRIEVAGRSGDGAALVSVRDTGIGIPSGELTRIFERFHRTREARAMDAEAPGLGLAIAKSIVEANGGRIWAESAPGGGSAFYFTLPLG